MLPMLVRRLTATVLLLTYLLQSGLVCAMRGGEIDGFNWDAYHKVILASGDLSSHIISVFIPIDGDVCGQAELLLVQGHDPLIVRRAISEALADAHCIESMDGAHIDNARTGFLFFTPVVYDSSFESLQLYAKPDKAVSRLIQTILNEETIYSKSALDDMLSQCKATGNCRAGIVLASLFGRASSLQAEGRVMTASMWRDTALTHTIYSSALREIAKHGISLHALKLYQYAAETRDIALAKEALSLSARLNVVGRYQQKMQSHFDDWYEQSSSDDAPRRTRFTLSPLSPFTADSGGTRKYLWMSEFSIVDTGSSIEHAFLHCRADDEHVQVYLNTSTGTRWKVPRAWSNCYVTLLGAPSSYIELWEYPASPPDGNGPRSQFQVNPYDH